MRTNSIFIAHVAVRPPRWPADILVHAVGPGFDRPVWLSTMLEETPAAFWRPV
jgi:hypothetical protein